MTNRLAQVFFTVIPLIWLVACSTHQTVHNSGGRSQAALTPEPQFVPETEPIPAYPEDETEQAYETGNSSELFPRPRAIEPQVSFWRNVYGTWSRSQVVFHDNRYMNVVYEVFQLPGEVVEGYTPMQKELLQERFDYWKYRLRDVEVKLAAGAALNADDQRLARQIAQSTNARAVIQGASERLRYQRGLRERFKRGLEISGRYDRRFREIFRRAGLPEDLAYLPHVESSFQANARSSAGALGMWQFTAGAAKMFMNGNSSVTARLNPIASAEGAARYLSHAYNTLGTWPLAVTSYNHGIGGMQRAKDRFGYNFPRIVKDYDHPLFGFASRNYYAEFLAARDIANDPGHFFPEGVRYESGSDWTFAGASTDAAFTAPPRAPRSAQPPLKVASASRIEPSKTARFSPRKVARVEPLKAVRFDPKKTGRVSLPPGKPSHSSSGSAKGAVQQKATRSAGGRTVVEKKVPRSVPVRELRTADNRSQPGRVASNYR